MQKGLAQLRKEDVSTDHERAEKKKAPAGKAEPIGRKAQRMPTPRKQPQVEGAGRESCENTAPPRKRAHHRPKAETRRHRDRSPHRVTSQDAEWCVSLLLRADRPRFHAVRALAGGEAIDAGFVHVEAVAAVAGAVDGYSSSSQRAMHRACAAHSFTRTRRIVPADPALPSGPAFPSGPTVRLDRWGLSVLRGRWAR